MILTLHYFFYLFLRWLVTQRAILRRMCYEMSAITLGGRRWNERESEGALRERIFCDLVFCRKLELRALMNRLGWICGFNFKKSIDQSKRFKSVPLTPCNVNVWYFFLTSKDFEMCFVRWKAETWSQRRYFAEFFTMTMNGATLLKRKISYLVGEHYSITTNKLLFEHPKSKNCTLFNDKCSTCLTRCNSICSNKFVQAKISFTIDSSFLLVFNVLG